MEDEDSQFRQEHKMQHRILITSQVKKEIKKCYKQHDVGSWQNLNMDYILDNNIKLMLNFMHLLYPDYVREQRFP